MLKLECIHPDLVEAVSKLGHGDKILIGDGNYPLAAKTGKDAKRIYLGLKRDLPKATDVLEVLLGLINIEAAEAIVPDDDSKPPIYAEYEKLLPGVEIATTHRWDFYDSAMKDDVKLAISTGEQRTYACVILTVGCA